MGEVYRARDPRLNRDVALKVLSVSSAGDSGLQRRFEQEARAASALNHPNIVCVYDIGTENGRSYIVTELVEGESLQKLLRKEALPIRKLLDLAVQIADGLAATHQAGIWHRDLKPGNIMVTRDNRVKILDFGLAKLAPLSRAAEDETAAPLSEPGAIVGTITYMSPEQARGAEIDFRSDQFSFGQILYEMATGTRAFQRNTPVETLSAIMNEEPAPIEILNSKIPAPARWVVERCLMKDPNERYASTLDLYHDLRNIRDHLSNSLSPQEATLPRPKQMRWRGVLYPLLVLAGLAGGLALSASLIRSGRTELPFQRLTPLIADSKYETFPSWSPDARTVAYIAEVDGVYQLFTRAINSPDSVQLTKSATNCSDPFWSPDGSHIFYFALKDKHSALWRVSVAGGAPEVVIEKALRAALSPDGKTLAFLRNEFMGGGLSYSLWISSPPGSEARKQEQLPFGDKRYLNGLLQFTPDGKKIGIWIQLWDGTSEFWLLPHPQGQPRKILAGFIGSAPHSPLQLDAGQQAPASGTYHHRNSWCTSLDGRHPGRYSLADHG